MEFANIRIYSSAIFNTNEWIQASINLTIL